MDLEAKFISQHDVILFVLATSFIITQLGCFLSMGSLTTYLGRKVLKEN